MTEPKPLTYKSLQGLTEKQISEHHDVLYVGYVKKTDELREALKTVDLTKANQTYSQLRAVKIEEGFAVNGVRLHEGYFAALGGKGGRPSGNLLKMIEEDFGSYEKWEAEFKALGMAARGWVVLAFDWQDMKLHNYICDAHNQGGIWDCSAVLILDVYEHAYFLDYGTNRKEYIEIFMKNLNWGFMEEKAANARMFEMRSPAQG
ncbi:MAG: Fe-Mn family superoxide dismutase [Candidatus Diapherotrites archaeon]|nr:Fe-Mn family superoxide dismutase [Candidatus Diapherotrites archaeon]MDZ4256717.1 Fe-Mn family superoxide dismutase [archaeon]